MQPRLEDPFEIVIADVKDSDRAIRFDQCESDLSNVACSALPGGQPTSAARAGLPNATKATTKAKLSAPRRRSGKFTLGPSGFDGTTQPGLCRPGSSVVANRPTCS
jgi:hypothetical protein